MNVAEIDALLYLPIHASEQLERALRIRALSQGWQDSFQAILGKQFARIAEISDGNIHLPKKDDGRRHRSG
jgi:hypothetical protein